MTSLQTTNIARVEDQAHFVKLAWFTEVQSTGSGWNLQEGRWNEGLTKDKDLNKLYSNCLG